MERSFTLEKLEEQTRKMKDKKNARAREGYSLAKELGFNSYECLILQQRSESTIRRLAADRKAQRNG